MVKRPCLRTGCNQTMTVSYCAAHRRDRNLARNHLTVIYHRDKATCQLCGGQVTPLGTTGSLSPHLDHIVPIANGGNDHPTNLRLTHSSCNASRG